MNELLKARILKIIASCWFKQASMKEMHLKSVQTMIDDVYPSIKAETFKAAKSYSYFTIPSDCTSLIAIAICELLGVTVKISLTRRYAEVVFAGTDIKAVYLAVKLFEIVEVSLFAEHRTKATEDAKVFLETAKGSQPNIANFYRRRLDAIFSA